MFGKITALDLKLNVLGLSDLDRLKNNLGQFKQYQRDFERLNSTIGLTADALARWADTSKTASRSLEQMSQFVSTNLLPQAMG